MQTVLGRIITTGLVVLLATAAAAAAQKKQPPPSGAQIDSSGFDVFEAGSNEHKAGHVEEAIKLYDRALEIEPDLWNAHYGRGVALLQLGRAAEAEKSLRRAVEIEGEIAAPHAAL